MSAVIDITPRWTKHPGIYRLFEVGHVVGADMNREFMFEAEDRDTNGITLVRVYSRPIPAPHAPASTRREET